MKRYRDGSITATGVIVTAPSVVCVSSDANDAAAATARLRATVQAAVDAERSVLDVPSIRVVLQSVDAALDASDSSSSSSALPVVPEGMAEEQHGLQQDGVEHVEQQPGSEQRDEHLEHGEEPCSICYEIKDRATLDGCKHAFCSECIETACKRKRSCPLCRADIHWISTTAGTIPAPTPEREDGASVWTDEQYSHHLASIREERRAVRAREREELAQIEAEATGGGRDVDGEVVRPSPTAPTREERVQLREQRCVEQSPEQSESEPSEPEQPESVPEQSEQPEPPPPSFEALNWNLTSMGGTPVIRQLYDAAVEAGTLLVRTEVEARGFQTTLMATVPSINRAGEAADAQGQSIAWHATDYTADKLLARDFKYCASPTISCIFHEATTDRAGWCEVVHVYIPSGFLESSALDQVRTALTAAADARFEFGVDEPGRPISKDKAPGSVFGETDVLKRGGKSMEGKMRMYGCHMRRAAMGESVPDRARRWPAPYGPKGARNPVIESTIHNLATALTSAETEFSPGAAESRQLIAEKYDPEAKFRVVYGDHARSSTPFSMSLSAGYVVSPHDDSGLANEFIGFVYPTTKPLPNGHEWLFVVSGCIHPLPKTPDEVVLISVRGNGVAHGTLPTSSTEAHCANHPGVGSALVNKKEMVDILDQMKQPGALPPPSEDELTANRKREKEAAAKEAALAAAKAAASVAAASSAAEASDERDGSDESGEGSVETGDDSVETGGEGEVECEASSAAAAEVSTDSIQLLTGAGAERAERTRAINQAIGQGFGVCIQNKKPLPPGWAIGKTADGDSGSGRDFVLLCVLARARCIIAGLGVLDGSSCSSRGERVDRLVGGEGGRSDVGHVVAGLAEASGGRTADVITYRKDNLARVLLSPQGAVIFAKVRAETTEQQMRELRKKPNPNHPPTELIMKLIAVPNLELTSRVVDLWWRHHCLSVKADAMSEKTHEAIELARKAADALYEAIR